MNLSNINPEEFTISAFIIGYLLRDNFTANEQNTIGNWLMLVGQTLETSAAQMQLIQGNNQNIINDNQSKDIENIKKAIKIIYDKLNNI